MNDNVEDRDLHGVGAEGGYAGVAPQPAFALDEDERLPWLESADDDDDGAIDTGRLVRFVAIAIALLAAILGGIWYLNHRAGAKPQADGGVIQAPGEPYKTEPNDKGGKTFAGTGDSAYAVSEGKSTPAKLAGGEGPEVKPSASPSPSASASSAPKSGTTPAAEAKPGVGVQVGAYSSQATAEAGWNRLASANAALKGLKHRIVEGSADIGTVYRLQAVASDLAAANALCSELKAAGVACQVKH